MAHLCGSRAVVGFPKEVRKLDGLPEGAKRLRFRFRAGEIARVFVTMPGGIASGWIELGTKGVGAEWGFRMRAMNLTGKFRPHPDPLPQGEGMRG